MHLLKLARRVAYSLGFISLFFLALAAKNFKSQQSNAVRVKAARGNYGQTILNRTKELGIQQPDRLYLRHFKQEGILEAWISAKNAPFVFYKRYVVCAKSGKLGPKNKQGDLQVPEGLYHIDRFNPNSNFHLSLGIDYPNAADRARSHAKDLGGDIFIHGDCVTIGCVPIQSSIEELYILALDIYLRSKKQKIRADFFPFEMSNKKLQHALASTERSQETKALWQDLAMFYQHFEQGRQLPRFRIQNGRYQYKNDSSTYGLQQ